MVVAVMSTVSCRLRYVGCVMSVPSYGPGNRHRDLGVLWDRLLRTRSEMNVYLCFKKI